LLSSAGPVQHLPALRPDHALPVRGAVQVTQWIEGGVHVIGWTMIGVSVALLLLSVLDRTLPRRTAA
jgi:hypothetical protein